MIAFVSSIIADIQGDYPNYSWWSLAFMLMCIVAVFVTVATDSVHTYHVALVGLLSAGLVFTTSSVNSLIYYSDAAKEAAAAGFILLSMVSVCRSSFYFNRHPPANNTSRSFGSFTTVRNRLLPTVALSTPSHCTKMVHLLAAADTCRKTPTDQILSALAVINHKCTTPISSLASKLHHP
jgi:SHO1 osmosensor